MGKKIQLIGAVVSERPSKIEEFHRELSVQSSKTGEMEPRNNMQVPGENDLCGVVSGVVIPLDCLKQT